MRRSTVQRATWVPSRLSCAQTLSAPYTPSMFCAQIRAISRRRYSSRTWRADGGRFLWA